MQVLGGRKLQRQLLKRPAEHFSGGFFSCSPDFNVWGLPQ
ncbi:hypothetical protein C4K13_1489 [Pseudomonas chlororaphis subsp. aureofaciens]|nr:hypothetical protein C4K13_1489 [Pseudomonas chlororaphis subsp. aureofaciens]AZD97385.1 hypothetical protein C4K12_1504 [Pseudomonas chlororaphis subsp. aureofaciens]